MSTELTIECLECGHEYDPEEESAEDHAEGCSVRVAKVERGVWEEP